MSAKPLVLITNDDGLEGEGMRSLIESLVVCPIDVLVACPSANRSACSMSLTLGKRLGVKPVKKWSKGEGDVSGFAVDGTPCDAVLLALDPASRELTQGRLPDLVVSGVNHGPNVGVDLFHSGTVAGAREGAFHGFPSLAASLADFGSAGLHDAVTLTVRIILRLLDFIDGNGTQHIASQFGKRRYVHEFTPADLDDAQVHLKEAFSRGELFLNLNIPPVITQPLQLTRPGVNIYKDPIRKIDEGGWMIGAASLELPYWPGSDVTAVAEGSPSLSVLPTWPVGHPFHVSGEWLDFAHNPDSDGFPGWWS